MISVVVPLYNEQHTVHQLHAQLVKVLSDTGDEFEIIFVDDGSTDATFDVMKQCTPIRAIRLYRNAGQTAAFACGIAYARGNVVVTMDGDLENQPEDIPRLLAELEKGYDVVAGWRQNRWASQPLTRRLPSMMANWLISRITGIHLHDHGCSLRAYRAGILGRLVFVGDMHRMLAAHLGIDGACVTEVPVNYNPRPFGQSKYGLSRTFKVLLDLLAFHFFRKYRTRPMHFFGYVGFASMFLGGLASLWALGLRFFQDVHLNRTPLPVLIAMFMIVGVQFILMGLLAEVFIRLYYQEKGHEIYEVAESIEHGD